MATQTITFDPAAASAVAALSDSMAQMAAVAQQLQGFAALQTAFTNLDQTARTTAATIDRTVGAALGGFTQLEGKVSSLATAIRNLPNPPAGGGQPAARPDPPAWPVPKDAASIATYAGIGGGIAEMSTGIIGALRWGFGKRTEGCCCDGGGGGGDTAAGTGRRELPSRASALRTHVGEGLTSARTRARKSVTGMAVGASMRLDMLRTPAADLPASRPRVPYAVTSPAVTVPERTPIATMVEGGAGTAVAAGRSKRALATPASGARSITRRRFLGIEGGAEVASAAPVQDQAPATPPISRRRFLGLGGTPEAADAPSARPAPEQPSMSRREFLLGREGSRRRRVGKMAGKGALLTGGALLANALLPTLANAQGLMGGRGGGGGGGLGDLAMGGLAMAGGSLMGGGGGMLGLLGKGLKMTNPVGMGMMAAGMASTAVADGMAARGVALPEPGAMAGTAGALTGFDPRLIQVGIDFLMTVPGLLSQAWAGITAVVTPWAESFAGFMRNIVTGAQNLWNGLVTFFTATLPAAFSTAWGMVTGVFQAMGGLLSTIVGGVVTAIMTVFNGLITYYTVTVPAAFTTGVNLIRELFAGLAAFFTDTVPAAFTALGERMMEFKDNLVALATGAVEGVKGVFEGLRTFVTQTLPQGFTEFLGTLGGWRDRVVGLAGDVTRSFVAGLRGIPDFFLNTLPGMLRTGASGVIDALIDGLIAAAGSIPGVGSAIAGKLADYLQGNSPPKLGPLKDIIVGGANIIAAWGKGLAGGAGPAVQAALGVARSVWNVFTRRRAPAVPVPAVTPPAALGLAGTAGGAVTGATAVAGGVTPEAPAKPGMGTQMLGMVTEKFGGLVASLGPLGMVATLLEGVFQGLAPLIDSLKEPLRIVGTILGAALAPVLKLLFPIFKVVAIAATYIGQIFFIVASGIAKAIGSVIKALGTAIDKVPFLGDFGLKKLGQGMIDTGKGFSDSARDLAKGREEIRKLEFGETAKSAEQANEAMRNVPEGFKIALARFNVATPAAVSGPSAVTTTAPPAIGTASVPVYASDSSVAVQSNPVTIQAVHIASDDPEKIWHRLRDVMERNNVRRGGSPMAAEMAMM